MIVKSTSTSRCAATAIIVGALTVSGCASGQTSNGTLASQAAAPTLTSSQIAALCESWVASDTASQDLLQIDSATSPQDVQALVKVYWAEEERIMASLEAEQAPTQLQPDIDVLMRLARLGQVSGDSAPFFSSELPAADWNIDQYMLQACDYPQLQVIATDNNYNGVPATLSAGTVAITLINQGHDTHEVRVSRVDDATQPFGDILNQLGPQGSAQVTPKAQTWANSGASSTVFVHLAPGRYGVFDSYTQGTTSPTAPGTGPPHYTLGMVGEFTVP